jgi:hypothetical protein
MLDEKVSPIQDAEYVTLQVTLQWISDMESILQGLYVFVRYGSDAGRLLSPRRTNDGFGSEHYRVGLSRAKV